MEIIIYLYSKDTEDNEKSAADEYNVTNRSEG